MLALSMVACGDREDFLQFLGILPSRREGKMPRNCKRESCRGSASARTRLLRSPERVTANATESYVSFLPLGVVFALMPLRTPSISSLLLRKSLHNPFER